MTATYLYCVVAAATRPRINARRRGLPGTGPVRVLNLDTGLYAVVADAPSSRYSEDVINKRLSDIDWVSRAAVAHEAVIEQFVGARAVLPMKLFTIFTSDERALDHLRAERARIDALVTRVADQAEWGVRVLLDRAAARAAATYKPAASGRNNGLAYLAKKKARRDAAAELATRARETVADLYDRLSARSRSARRRAPSDLPERGSLLLDAAFLVPRSKSATFRRLAASEARALAPHGYRVTMSGPWPPYSFVHD